MRQKIKQLESAARLLEPDVNRREQLLNQVTAYSQAFLEGIPNAPANGVHSDGRNIYASPIAEQGIDMGEALDLLWENVDSTGINTTSGRFLGYIPGGGLFPAALGDYLAAIANRYAGHFFASPGAVRMENMLLAWMAEVTGYPENTAGNLTSGGSIANLIAIVAARDTHGISGERLAQAVVYLTEHAHHSVGTALDVAGLDGTIRRQVPVDARYRMDAGALEQTIIADKAAGLYPWLIVAAAGTTNPGPSILCSKSAKLPPITVCGSMPMALMAPSFASALKAKKPCAAWTAPIPSSWTLTRPSSYPMAPAQF
jgi:aromatic-L-amino-acid decarboxylase